MSHRFKTGDKVRYTGAMLPQIAGRELTVMTAHVRSGFGDPETDDVCIVWLADGYRGDYRVSSCNLQVAA